MLVCLGPEDGNGVQGAQVMSKPTGFMLMVWIEQWIGSLGIVGDDFVLYAINYDIPIEVLSSLISSRKATSIPLS